MEESIDLREIELVDGQIMNMEDTDGNLESMENCVFILYDETDQGAELDADAVIEQPDENKKPKKRRANLTVFNESQSTKRKNETAKRELTSIVKQLEKIDKQLNNKDDKRATINFVATFNSFQSNRISTFKYPSEAEIKPKFLDFDGTMSAVKVAVQEAMSDYFPQKQVAATVTAPLDTSIDFTTPTKTISAFTTIPSPANERKSLPTSSKNLCGRNACSFEKKIRKPVWVKCSYDGGDGKTCSYWVHAACIGFPALKEADAKSFGAWHCPDHTESYFKRK
ncbi:uncharacterized protein LOC119082470 [Bradysia coprophila]|uniref:uncharacterized protein LOC119082470 n=1 Tax=Bradysia coprophila TaxID=38358 RepID=UPI00187DB2E0|nr:uncharacterized protein LOC119082470 [Bradysia coprophila]